MSNHKQLLKSLEPCSAAYRWYNNRNSYEVWRTCKRGDWLIWLAVSLRIDPDAIEVAVQNCYFEVQDELKDYQKIGYKVLLEGGYYLDCLNEIIRDLYNWTPSEHGIGSYTIPKRAQLIMRQFTTIIRREILWRLYKERIEAIEKERSNDDG